ncbi:hypothetical protein HYH03_018230 [Edaphochlamys debaryana]|uniref:Uncharacterized protein n=1 Tax=Edaphochlamys debaryana TaxID=47281 RepID=A0A835XGY9_9CHLO|nr:hypothetical protein HYH03_018230 [Edaphochlamys debaryana]|eukprot:KAG2482887.1 hypothetical protein HYH03_018230 [Edaphochlamys debaryana]
MTDIRPRHLSFEDLSGSLKPGAFSSSDVQRAGHAAADQAKGISGQNAPSMTALSDQLKSIASAVQDAHGALEQRLDAHRKAALDQLEDTGGRQALESHLKAQKANWKFVGQKEAFLERLKQLGDVQELLCHDFSSDIAIADKAVATLKEEIKERQAAISKAEQQLAGTIQQVVRLHDSAQTAATHLALQLPRIAAELHEYGAGREEPRSAQADAAAEAELLRLLAEEQSRAAQLEEQAAREAAGWGSAAAELGALAAAVAGLRADVAAAEEECSQAARQQGAKYSDQLNWSETLSSAVSRLTGVELAGQEGALLHLTLTQTIPRAMPGREVYPTPASGSTSAALSQPGPASLDPSASAAEAGGVGAVAAEHVLTLEMEGRDTAMLRGASLNPPAVDISEDVRAARAAQEAAARGAPGSGGGGGGGGVVALADLVWDVKARIRQHCRRQLQLEDAHELYPLQPTHVSPALLRCVLPNQVEAEVEVPLAWPEEPGTRLRLVGLQAPRASQALGPLLSRLQRELDEACGEGATAGPGPAVVPLGAAAEGRRRRLRGCGLRELLDWVYGSLVADQGAGARE